MDPSKVIAVLVGPDGETDYELEEERRTYLNCFELLY